MTRILLVEDELLVRELAFEDLSDEGFEVSAAGTGEDALALLREDGGFDLLLTDIRLPGAIDGWRLAEEGKRLIPGLKVIYATGLADDEGRLGSEDRFLKKPYRKETMLRHVEELGLSA